MDTKNWIIGIAISIIVGFVGLITVFFPKDFIFWGNKVIEPNRSVINVSVEEENTTFKSFSDPKKNVNHEISEPNIPDNVIKTTENQIIHPLLSDENIPSIPEFVGSSEDVIPSIVIDFISRDLIVFVEYSRLIREVRQSHSKESVTELLDLGLSFIDGLMVREMSYEDVLFVLGFCKKMHEDIEMVKGAMSPIFMQIAHDRILLTECSLPRERAALVDLDKTQNEFHKLAELRLSDAVLERQRRYILFMAQTEGILSPTNENGNYTEKDYHNYYILQEVLRFPPLGSDASVRDQITTAKINIAANIEYARRDFLSNSKDVKNKHKIINSEETLTRYKNVLAQYEKTLMTLDSLEDNFGEKLNLGDKLYIAKLKQRAASDYHRVPWQY